MKRPVNLNHSKHFFSVQNNDEIEAKIDNNVSVKNRLNNGFFYKSMIFGENWLFQCPKSWTNAFALFYKSVGYNQMSFEVLVPAD